MNCYARNLTLMLSSLLLASASHGASMTLEATDSGWHDDNGNHTFNNQNYVAGWSNNEFRNFFVFDLSGLPVTESVTAATLRLYNPDICEPDCSYTGGYDSPDATETYELREVLLAASVVTAPSVGNTSVFDDLGDGPVFGTVTASAADNGSFIEITLNGAGIAHIQTFFGVGDLVLGGLVTSLTSQFGTEESVWALTDPQGLGPYSRQLELLYTPEPGTGLLLGLGLLGLATRRQRLA